MNMTFGQWLKHERARLGLTQRDIEQRTGIAASHISKFERGSIRTPDDATRDRLHHALGTSDEDLASAGVMVAVRYRDGQVRYQWPDGAHQLIPPAQVPAGTSSGDAAFYEALGEYLPALGSTQRAHLVETARLMAGSAVRRESIPAASPSSDPVGTQIAPDRSSER